MELILEVTHAGTGVQSMEGDQIIDSFNCSIESKINHKQRYKARPFAQLGVYQKETKIAQKRKGLTFGYVVENSYFFGNDDGDSEENHYYINNQKVSKGRYQKTKKRLGW